MKIMLRSLCLSILLAVGYTATPVKDPSTRCPTDIVYVVDQSTSVTRPSYYDEIVPFLVNMTNELDIGTTDDHLAFVPFSSPAETGVVFYLNFSDDKEQLIEMLQNQRFTGGTTATVRALTLVRDDVFSADNGARTSQYGKTVAPTVLIITDGIATDGDASIPATQLRDDGVNIFAVGVGPEVTNEYLVQIAGDQSNVFSVANFDDLNQALINAISASTQCSTKK